MEPSIDPEVETVVPLSDVPKHVPKRRGGKKLHPATAYRWSTRGLRGVVLETIQIGGTRCTSLEALARFYAALSAISMNTTPSPPVSIQTSARRRREIAAAEAALEREGA